MSMKRIITKTTTKEHDTIVLQNLLLDLVKRHQNFRIIANTDTHGQMVGLKMRGHHRLSCQKSHLHDRYHIEGGYGEHQHNRINVLFLDDDR